MSNFFEELKRRNVYKVAVAYLVTAWLIIQVVSTVGPNLNWPDSIAPLTTRILLVGFPIALVLAWLYEFTPQGLKRTGAVQQDTTDNRKAGRRINRLIIGSLSLVLILMLVERLFLAGSTLYPDKQMASIAVLPFANMSSEEENEYFADGLTEQILDELANLSGLQVTARTSSFKFKNKNEDVRKIAEQLTVNYVLEGSVQYDSRRNRIKITAQLINAYNGYHLWSETYEDDFDEVFGIQEDVSRKVAKQLRIQLLPDEDKVLSTKLTENTEAYKFYIRARQFSVKRDDKNLEQAISLLNQALEIDPEFAEAHAELSFLYPQRFFYGNLSKEVRDERMDFHLKKALSIAPNKPEVLKAEASYHLRLRIDSSKAISNLRKAIELKPNYADAHYALFQALGWAKQMELGVKSLERAVELDPLDFFATILAMNYYRNKEYEKAFSIVDNIIANDPSAGAARRKALWLGNEPYGNLVEGFKLIHEAGKKDPYLLGNLNYHVLFPLNLDLWPVSEKYMNQLQMRYPDNMATFYNVSHIYELKKDYPKWEEWIDFWVSEKNLDPEEEAKDRAWLNGGLQNYQKAISILEHTFTYLKKNTIDVDSLELEEAEVWVYYIDYLRMNNENKKADSFSQEICKYYNKIIEEDSFTSYTNNDIQLDCFYISNDTTNFLKALEERFFIKKDRREVFSEMKLGIYKRFKDNSGYKALEKRITEEVHRQRAEVIAYLKEEGDWDPAWEKELGLE
jgi:TolB-like protein